ncbi:uncharacterized protein Z518_00477 [Rhinocladiella mackenziei CBS 650.93]|uniref:Rhinocladiella mackenziei CBS 650.93 unplaced genomic scaffold supercont1.1, whole genome shotgun sequence n=1 Tax=Rhinocladiella mackenziei CBS 650.93 TaxID=1442369 RepID=A0A0D2HFC5_9EURO|nr:uncharacterized protein Z518_00477 [Rhinocladiella mackenziei CBS 650.93]KIX09398.1 hypothetical protein Z518_00477 [Rhinocladiella mackenziei CBS 650.93]
MDGLQLDDSHRDNGYAPTYSDKVVSSSSPSHTSTTPIVLPQHDVYNAPVAPDAPTPQSPRRRLPWGLSILAYTLLIAVITFLITAGAVGGALGGVLASQDDSDSSTQTQTATVTVTNTAPTASATPSGLVNNYTPLLPDQVNTTALQCVDQATINSATGEQFQLNCNINFPDNDMINIIAYTLDACINACSNMNTFAGEEQCRGILFNANLQKTNANQNGNCWLKSIMANPSVDRAPPSVGAVLLSS